MQFVLHTRRADITWTPTTNQVEHVEYGNYSGQSQGGHYSNKHNTRTSTCYIDIPLGVRRTGSTRKGIGISK